MNCEKNHNHPLSRVRAYAIYNEVLHFCCHKCHSVLVNNSISIICADSDVTFNTKVIRVLYIRLTCQQKTCSFLLHCAKFLSLSSPISSFGVILVTAKKQHRCWNARATRTREENAQCDSSLFLVRLFCLLLLDSARIPIYNPTILISRIIKLDINTK